MNESYEFQGKTVDDAVAEGLIKLGLSREQVEIEVIHKGSRGIFGLGSEAARVRISLRSSQGTDGAAMPTEPPVATASPTQDIQNSGPLHQDASGRTSLASEQSEVELRDEDEAAGQRGEGASTATHGAWSTDEFDEDENDDLDEYDSETEWDETSDEGLADFASDLLEQMVTLMGYQGEVVATWQEPEPGDPERCLMLEVNGDGLSALIGRRGETLSNIQFLLRLMINQKTHSWYNVVVDVAGYKQRRAEQLTQLAMRIAEQVVESGRSASLEPMPSNERRIIHMALRDHADVFTQSSGEGERRKVHIVPKD